ncbi:ribosome small subunit-dependent GTPase A [Haloimpatiens sp. FM7315]|uniref:ribosome small subunit-dependent GTPase A n=1 Tax=Haloimpatiens sp. FM7315 TaxID=3298609 RepID=UPI00370B250F
MEGIIVKGIGGNYYVKTHEELIKCKARGKFRFDDLTPMVGDKVNVVLEKGEGLIDTIYERHNDLIRPFVANVTQAFIIVTLKNPKLNFNLLNSFLVLCECKKLKITVCFNKMDLVDDKDEESIKAINIIKKAGYEVALLNAKKNIGIEVLKGKLSNEVTVFCGPSGVGKSTILNAISGRKIMETGEISLKSKRGKHTTRHSELIEVNEGFLVDTPGFSSLDMKFLDKQMLLDSFIEFHNYSLDCKFSDCLHNKEPQCAVKKALIEGKISQERYDFYVKTLEEILSSRRNKK